MRQDAKKKIGTIEKGKRCDFFNQKSIELLKEWLEDNLDHPYIERRDLIRIQEETGLTKKQIMGWCTNIRRRRLTVVRDPDGSRKLIPLENPEKKRKKNESGERKPIVLANKKEESSDEASTNSQQHSVSAQEPGVKENSENTSENIIQNEFKEMPKDCSEESSPKLKQDSDEIRKSEEALKKLKEELKSFMTIRLSSSTFCWCELINSFDPCPV
ncbi:unnamed protein product [Moneuplotes crassus]|uniref:KN homeodomain domain-containing protein n=1 Tax=Euplotes crassus TaxID=5936 RepID=A0AAD1UM16_EUPCR|nr:unnamed protein product [Moneuplotes crassus]